MKKGREMMKRKIPKFNWCGLSYEQRIRRYDEEKQAMYAEHAGASAAELERLRDALVKKWGI